jgi:hypothetical protein
MQRLFILGLFALTLGIASAHAENVALGKVAWANSTLDPYLPSRAVDGNLDTFWDAGDLATQTDANWLSVDLGAVYSVNSIVLTDFYSHGQWEGYYVDYLLYASLDGTGWGDPLGQGSLVDTADMSQRSDIIDVAGKDMRYIWFIGIGGTHWTHLAELEVNAVPEPSTFIPLCIAAISLLGYAWRRR